ARPICPHSNGGSLVQASRRGLHLSGTDHPARSRSGRSHPPTRLAVAPATPTQNLPDHNRKCVDNLRPLQQGSTERKSSEWPKNAKVRLRNLRTTEISSSPKPSRTGSINCSQRVS